MLLNCLYNCIFDLFVYPAGLAGILVVNNASSEFVNITSGIPQDSHSGPLLFSLFTNDIIECILHMAILLYADDMKLSRNTEWRAADIRI